METPYLTEEICRKRFLGFCLPIPLIGIVLCIVALMWKPMIISGLLAGLLIGVGPLLGGATAWFRLKMAVRQGAQIVDPSKAKAPSEIGLFFCRHRFVGTALSWLLATNILMIALVGNAPEEIRPIAVILVGFFSLLLGGDAAIQYWGMRRYSRLLKEAQQLKIGAENSEPQVTQSTTWWTQDETRQEIRRH